ncbi:MAG: hypothetical protein ACYTGQ_15525, partial [Planctomycetota bacterium]
MSSRWMSWSISLTLFIAFNLLQNAYAAEPPASNTGGFTTAGFAERDISPDIGMEKPGNYGKVFHSAFHDACKARAVVFGEGANRVALVGVDALLIRRPQVEEARRRIAAATGIAPGAVLIGASHSHSSGPVGMILPGEFDFASPFIQKLAYEYSSTADGAYLKTFVDGIVEAVVEADANRAPLRAAVGSGHEGDVALNRRFRMKNGRTITHPRQGNPDIVGVAGPIDPEVGVIGAWNAEGELVGCIVNYACHATASPPGISANWIYHTEKTIRSVMGPDVVVVFLQGACGDITQVDNLSPYVRPNGAQASKIVGGSVGAETVKVLYKTELHAGAMTPTVARRTTLTIPRRKPSQARVVEADAIVRS